MSAPRLPHLLLVALCLGLLGCPETGRGEDDDDAADDDDSGDDDDATSDDDDASSDDDDATSDDDDATSDDDDATGDDDDATPPPLPIVGQWEDFGVEFAITESYWLQWGLDGTYRYTITQFDAAAGWLVAENHPSNPTEAGLWSRFEWTNFGAQYDSYCQVVNNAATEAAALAGGPADPTDEWTGCNGDDWGELEEATYVFAPAGIYTDSAGTDVQITSDDWIETGSAGTYTYEMRIYGITDPYAVMQNGAANPSYPNLYSRWDVTWTGPDLWVCHTVENGADQAAAELATEADDTSPSTGGCVGGPWRALTPL